MKLIDITLPISPGMVVYAGNPEVHLERSYSIAAGDPANISRLDFGVHTGTHIDAPLHFIDGAAGAEALPLEALVGPAVVVDATSLEEDIDEAALETLDLPDGAERCASFPVAPQSQRRLGDRSSPKVGDSAHRLDRARITRIA